MVIVASKGGADEHPEWYLNLRASEHVDVQIATQAFRATWREPEDEERHRIWDFMVSRVPAVPHISEVDDAAHPRRHAEPGPSIEVFRESDLQSS